MKTSHRLVAAALSVPLSAFAQTSDPAPTRAQEAGAAEVGRAPVAEPVVRRVEHTDLTRAFTVRDLIGKNVVNYDGERLGTINDVGLSEKWNERFGVTPTADAEADEKRAALPLRDAEQSVYISTGGVLGIGGRLGLGADWVSVPADSLLYDRAQDRFILNLPQARFASIAQGRPRIDAAERPDASPPAERGPMIGRATGPNLTSSSAAREAVQQVEAALQADRELRDRARIQVSHTGSVVQLSGEVDDAALIRRAGDLAREHTELEVRNLLEVSASAAE